ncbi:hypothetical protein [Alienimonas californiensis]|uniref:DUF11 domain-containing protein n=1 Tax=Alienimonas californiensis TaxID=2527989 RepID=A0A517PAP7_9PLAN|nr:hypothetical protein [Alienimonas californiensis]QDT16447.1 hypothetical protein CA12_25500 [Alienimonas californiensis]
MSDRRRRRRHSGGSDRPQDVFRNASDPSRDDREPAPAPAPSHGERDPWAEYEARAPRSQTDRDARSASPAEPADDGTLADALAEYERRRDALIQARREETGDDRPRRDRDRRTDDAAAEQDDEQDWSDRDWAAEAEAEGDGDDEEPADAGRGLNPARRGLGASRPNPALSAAVFEQDADDDDGPAPSRVRPVAAPPTPRQRNTVAVAAETADARRGYSLRTPREVRRDGPVAWTLRGYRRFRRQLRQNLTAYGHRYHTVGPNAATDSKPALLWLVDFPRLVGMWASHVDYRTTRAVTLTFRDLRSRPTRIPFSAAEVLSPHVAFTVPTCADLNPIWRWPAVRTWTREFRNDWRNALALAAAGAGAAVAGAKEEFSAELAAVGDRTGRGLAWTQAQATRFDRLFHPTGRHDDRGWWFACGTGMCGLALTSLLFLQGAPANAEVNAVAALAPKSTKAGAPAVPDAALEPDRADFNAPADELFEDDLWGSEPGDPPATDDPTLIARGNSDPTLESDADMFGDLPNPFAEEGGMDALEPAPESYVRPLPALTIDLRRAEPDFGDDLPGYEPPDDDAPAEAVAAPVRTPLPADPGGWDEERRRSEPAAPALPPEYVGVPPDSPVDSWEEAAPSVENRLNDPSFDPDFPDDFGLAPDDDAPAGGASFDDNGGAAAFPDEEAQTDLDLPADGVPAAAGAGLTVTRTAYGAATLGAPYTYDLWVKNEGDAPATAVLEEAVGPGVRVTNAVPPASFLPGDGAAQALAAGAGAGGGILTWDLASLPPGAVRQLSVTVHPLPGANAEGNGEEIAFTTDARVTGRWAVAGTTVVMATPEPPPPAEPVNRWQTDWPSDPPIVNDFDDFPDEPTDLPLEEPFEEEPLDEPLAAEPEPFEEPAWEPQPLPDPAVRPAQILRPELDEEDEAPALETEPPPEPTPTEEPAAAPRLRVVLAGPRGVRAGEDVRLTVTVTNEGSGPAEAVTIACPVPERLRHPRGKVVQCLLGEMEPGEVRTASFIARAVDPGSARPELTVTADGGLRAAVTSPLTVRPAVVCR